MERRRSPVEKEEEEDESEKNNDPRWNEVLNFMSSVSSQTSALQSSKSEEGEVVVVVAVDKGKC